MYAAYQPANQGSLFAPKQLRITRRGQKHHVRITNVQYEREARFSLMLRKRRIFSSVSGWPELHWGQYAVPLCSSIFQVLLMTQPESRVTCNVFDNLCHTFTFRPCDPKLKMYKQTLPYQSVDPLCSSTPPNNVPPSNLLPTHAAHTHRNT